MKRPKDLILFRVSSTSLTATITTTSFRDVAIFIRGETRKRSARRIEERNGGRRPRWRGGRG